MNSKWPFIALTLTIPDECTCKRIGMDLFRLMGRQADHIEQDSADTYTFFWYYPTDGDIREVSQWVTDFVRPFYPDVKVKGNLLLTCQQALYDHQIQHHSD